jgi:hypothetical protein
LLRAKVFIWVCCGLFNIVTLNSNICSRVIVLCERSQKGEFIFICLLICHTYITHGHLLDGNLTGICTLWDTLYHFTLLGIMPTWKQSVSFTIHIHGMLWNIVGDYYSSVPGIPGIVQIIVLWSMFKSQNFIYLLKTLNCVLVFVFFFWGSIISQYSLICYHPIWTQHSSLWICGILLPIWQAGICSFT